MAVTTLEAPLASIVTFGWSRVGISTLSYRPHVTLAIIHTPDKLRATISGESRKTPCSYGMNGEV